MAKLLVNHPSGEQMLITVDATGSYFDRSKVLWDELVDGELPENIELGKMQRIGGNLIKAETMLSAHAEAVAARTFPIEIPMAPAREALFNAGLLDDIDTYIQTMSESDKIWWAYADKIHRAFPLVETVRVAMGLTSEQIDNLFLAAEQIRKQRAGES